MNSIINFLTKNRTIVFLVFILFFISASTVLAQTTVNFNTLTTDTDQSNPFNHTENSVTWILTVTGNSANIHTWGDGTVNFQTGPNTTLGSAKASIVRQDGADFNFNGIKLEASIQDQYVRVYGKNNGSTIFGPTSVDLTGGSLIQTFSPSGWNGVDEVELVIYAATSGTGGYDNDMYLFIDDFQYSMNVVPSISNLNGDSGTFTEGGSALTLDSGTGASVTDSDATGYNGGNVTVSISSAASSEDLIISTAGSVSLSSGMTASSTVSVSGTSIGTIASGKTGQDGSDLTVTLNSNATDARIGTLLQNITYTNDSQNPSGTRTVSFTVTDGASGTSTAASVTVTLSGTNDDPTLTGKPTNITVTEDVASNVDLSSATFGDLDAVSGTVTFTIIAGAGTLSASSGGSVTVTGSGTDTLKLSGTVSNIDTYLNTASNIKYTSASNANGNSATTLTLIANDGGNTGSGGGSNVSFGTVSVDITAVNDAPVLDNSKSPALTGISEDLSAPANGSTANSTLVSSLVDNGGSLDNYSDVEGDSPGIAIIAVNSGTIYYSINGGTNWTALGAVNATSAIVLNADANTRVYFKPDANVSGSVSNAITIKAWDRTTSSNGSTGVNTTTGTAFSSATDDVSISITAINDDPTLSGLPSDITVLEDVASNVDLSAATFADVDAGSNNVTLRIKAGSGTMSVAAAAGLSFTGNASDSITITGTVSNIDTYLNTASNILYTSAANANGTAATTLTISGTDNGNSGTGGGGNISFGTVNVDITAVNDPPVVSNVFGDNSSEVIAGSGVQNITDLDDATVTNVDSPDYDGGFLTITQGSGTANGSFGVDGTTATSGGDGTIAAGETIAVGGTSVGAVHATNDGQGGNNLQIDFNSANATSARIQTLIRSLTYSAPSGLGARVFTITLDDNDGTANGGDKDASGNITITVTPNPPIISNLDGDSTAVPLGGAAGNIDVGGNATVTDADSPNFNGGSLSIAQNTGTANGNFSVSGSGSSGVSSGASLGTADQTISGSELIYVDGVTVGSVSSTDNGQSGNDLVLNLGSNATPARTQQIIRSLKYAAPSGPGDRTFTLTIVDASSNSASGDADFKITVLPPEMDLKQSTTPIADGGSYNYGNKALNSNSDVVFTIHNTATGVLSISTPLTLGGADAGQFSIQAQPSTSVAANDSTTFTVRFTPTSAGSKTATISITNNDTNENPYDLILNGNGNTPPTGGNDEITISEDAMYSFAVTDFTFSDTDGDSFAGIQLQSLETAGTLKYNGADALTATDYSDVTKLTFTPVANANGTPYATFTYKVIDNNGGYSSSSYTMTINVSDSPDNPVIITHQGFSVSEGGSHTLSFSNLSASDSDGPSNLLLYSIIQSPLHGIIELNNTPSSSFKEEDIANALVTYTHNGDESSVDSFSVIVKDAEGNESDPATIVITISGVNDPPVISAIPGFVMYEDVNYLLDKEELYPYVSDPDNADSTLVFSFIGGINVSLNQVDSKHWNIIPGLNYSGEANIQVSVSDETFTLMNTINITILPVNDLPVISEIPDSLILAYEGTTSFTISGSDVETATSSLSFSLDASEGISAVYDPTSGMITVTSNQGFSGESLLTITLSDTDGGTSTKIVYIEVGNDPTGIERLDGIPETFSLSQNYPNPFNPTTKIKFGISNESSVTLAVYDILGRQVELLYEGTKPAGFYQYSWNAANFASGIYFYLITAKSRENQFREIKKMLLVK